MAKDLGQSQIQQAVIEWGAYMDGHEYEFGPEDYDGIEGADDEEKVEKLRNAAFSAASRNSKQAGTRKVTIADGDHFGRLGLRVQFFEPGGKPAKQSARRVG